MRKLLKSELIPDTIVRQPLERVGTPHERPAESAPDDRRPQGLQGWQVIAAMAFIAVVVWFYEPSVTANSDIESCRTDKPVNVTLCVDLGVGNHALFPAKH